MTERKYPRTMQEAFPQTTEAAAGRKNWEWWEGHQETELSFKDAEFWVYVTLAFAAGFLTHILWG